MNDKELEDLENPENWDWDNAETKSGTKNRRTIVSVAFPREDFKKVAECARMVGVSVSAFVRDAAVNTAEIVSREARKSNSIYAEPATYAIPSQIGTTILMVSGTAAGTLVEPVITGARPPRKLELVSNK